MPQINNAVDIATMGNGAHAIFAQSVGGGGGDAGHAAGLWQSSDPQQTTENAVININVGSTGGSSGDGGVVDVVHTAGSLATGGVGSAAIMAQSIGGGGGTGGVGAVGAEGSLVTVGSIDDATGNGGDVKVDFSGGGAIVTGIVVADQVVASYGIFAQSVGGGGGMGGNVLMGDESNFGSGLAGMSNGTDTTGDGGDVDVIVAADITAFGNSSVGIFAQSVGGGGGVAGQAGPTATGALIGSAGGSGNAGAVTVTYDGTLSTIGQGAHGIFAQSAAGQSTAGIVTVDVGGVISAGGAGAHGIFAQSVGITQNAGINVTVAPGGSVTGGSGASAIYLQDGAAKTVTNHGTLASMDGIASGIAVEVFQTGSAGVGTTTVDNFGTTSGQVFVHVNDGFFNNYEGGFFNTGTGSDLGDNGVLANAGTLSPGGANTILATTFSKGDLTQAATGMFAVDLNTSDLLVDMLVMDIGTADLEGSVEVNIVKAGLLNWQGTVTILTAGGGVSTETQSNLVVASTIVTDYSLSYPTADQIDLTYAINFINADILGAANDNQSAVTTHIQQILELGSLGDTLTSLANVTELDDYLDELDTLAPQILSDNQESVLSSSMHFNDALLSCAARDGAYRFVRQDQCGWLRLSATGMERDRTGKNHAFDQSAYQLAGGAQFNAGENWRLGAAFGVEKQDLSVEDLASSDGYFAQGGVVAKRSLGNSIVSASLSGGYGSFDVSRNIFTGDQATGTEDLWVVSGQVSASHAFTQGNWYVKPRVDVGFDHVVMNGFTETGVDDVYLIVDRNAETYFNVQPALEVGGELGTGGDVLIRPSLGVGLTQFLGNAAPSVTAAFGIASDGVPPFTVASELDKTYLDLKAGVDVLSGDNFAFSVRGFGQLSRNTQSYGGSAKMAVRF